MRKGRRRALWTVSIVVVIVIGAGIYIRLQTRSAVSNAATTTPAYLVETVSSGKFTGQVQSSGNIAPNTEATIQSPVNSILSTLNVNLGQRVSAGAIIGTLASGQTLTTPIAGIVVNVATTAGSYVTTGQTIATVADTSSIYANLTVPEQYIADIAAGNTVALTLPALPNQTFSGQVTEVGRLGTANSQGTVQFPVTVKLGSESNVYLGMTANATITTGTVTNALAVPTAAIETINGRTAVLVPRSALPTPSYSFSGGTGGFSGGGGYGARGGNFGGGTSGRGTLATTTPVPVYVKVGLSNTSQTQISSGLKTGEQVLIPNPAATTSNASGMKSGIGGGLGRGV